MPILPRNGSFALLICIAFFARPLRAQSTNGTSTADSIASLRAQVEELKTGQQRILRELDQIKQLLADGPVRSDVAFRPPPPATVTLNVTGEPFRGDVHAKVAVLEYSDFECSFCGKYVREIFPQIDSEYVKTGKIRYLFRDLPAPEHKNALAAAQAARCAGEQGKFWEMHDLLFASNGSLSPSDIESFAQALGLDMEKFKECLSSNKYAEAIRRSAAGAARSGIYGTPAFLVGRLSDDGNVFRATKLLVGSGAFEELRTALEEILKTSSNSN
jgi:protein-disulfide isomerase